MSLRPPFPAWAHEETHELLPLAINGRAKAIAGAFDWGCTREGAAYWAGVCREAKETGTIGGEARTRLVEMKREFMAAHRTVEALAAVACRSKDADAATAAEL